MVCTGNICRSPYAEYALAAKASGVKVSSAGLSALVDKGADATGLEVAAERGVDMTPHVAQQLNTAKVAGSDLVLVMDDEHCVACSSATPRHVAKPLNWENGWATRTLSTRTLNLRPFLPWFTTK